MEPIALAAVFINQDGVINGLDGSVDRFGLQADLVGRAWQDVFSGWPKVDTLPQDPAAYPCRHVVNAPQGFPVAVELIRLPGGNGAAHAMAILRRGEEHALIARQEQFYSLGELAAAVAHEINNALTLLHGWLDLILADMSPEHPNHATIELLIGETARIGKITSNLLDVARGAGGDAVDLDITRMLGEVLDLVQYQMKNSDIVLERRIAAELPVVHGSSGRLKQALINLLVNARQAMPSGGRVVVDVRMDEEKHVCVMVADNGEGMSDEVQERIFSPYFTTKSTGTGLGLPVTQRILEDHGGSIELESKVGEGTRFTLRLPAVVENE